MRLILLFLTCSGLLLGPVWAAPKAPNALERAALLVDANSDNAEAQYTVATLYEKGIGFQKVVP